MYVTNTMANIEVFNGPIRLNSDRDTLEKCFHLMSGNVIIINIYMRGIFGDKRVWANLFGKLNLTYPNPPNVFETQRTQMFCKV